MFLLIFSNGVFEFNWMVNMVFSLRQKKNQHFIKGSKYLAKGTIRSF